MYTYTYIYIYTYIYMYIYSRTHEPHKRTQPTHTPLTNSRYSRYSRYSTYSRTPTKAINLLYIYIYIYIWQGKKDGAVPGAHKHTCTHLLRRLFGHGAHGFLIQLVELCIRMLVHLGGQVRGLMRTALCRLLDVRRHLRVYICMCVRVFVYMYISL